MLRLAFVSLFVSSYFLSGCYRMRSSHGGGQTAPAAQRTVNAKDIAVHPGYKIEAITSGLTFPSAATFDDADDLYVIEAGYSYGEVFAEPRLLRIDATGKSYEVAKGGKNGPWTGITWHSGAFYVAEGGVLEGGRILRITKDGTITPLISNLPSMGDHHTNGPVVKDGYIYFGVGTATNSGVVGEDNAQFGWLLRKPDFHDIPCKDITLVGQDYLSADVLNKDSSQPVLTGAFMPFGMSSMPEQVVPGRLPCTGSVLRIPLTGGAVELVAWGLRNPFGFALAPGGRLFVTENAYDVRGSRPVWGSGDVLWEIKNGLWYGWPDFAAGKPISNDEEFKPPKSKLPVKPLLQNYPNTPPKPAAVLGVHSSSNGLDFSRSAAFGFVGEAFIAQFGDMAPQVGKVLAPVGFKVVRVDVNTGVVRDFAVNKGKKNGPATWLGSGGLERPVSVTFNPSGDALYVVDFGIVQISKDSTLPRPNTGVVWKITKTSD